MWSNAIISNMLCKLVIYYESVGIFNQKCVFCFQT